MVRSLTLHTLLFICLFLNERKLSYQAQNGHQVDATLLSSPMPQPHPLRLPKIDLAAALKQPNSQIDLRIEAYENSTRSFLKAVANYKNRAISSITDRRSSQDNEKKKILERTAAMEVETNQCKLREIELVAGVLQWLPSSTSLVILPVQTWRERRRKERMQNFPLQHSNGN